MSLMFRLTRRLLVVAACCLATGGSIVVVGADDGQHHRTYEAATFYETITYVMAAHTGRAFSPDGSMLLITSDETGVFNAYAQPVAGGDLTQLTTSTTNAIAAVSYFPSDTRILYTFDEGGNERQHLHVLEEDGVTSHDLTPGENVKAAFGGWNEDGSGFLVWTNARDERYFDVVMYDITTTDPSSSTDQERYNRTTVLYQNDRGLSVEAVSPDRRWVALIDQKTSADSDIYLVDLWADGNNQTNNQSTPILITEHEGMSINHGVYEFTKDSTELVYATNEHGEFAQAWTHNVETGEKAALVSADWDVRFVLFSPSGRYRVSAINADGTTELSIVDTQNDDGEAPLDLPDLPAGDLAQIRFPMDETMVAFLINSDTSPSNVFVVNLATQELTQHTQALSPNMRPSDLVEGEIIRYKSFDGLEIPSILYKPVGASATDPVPAVVAVHGGPGGQSKKGYRDAWQHLVNHGFAILAVNNRGSSGYGKTFYHMDDKKHGEVDLQDVVYGKHYLVHETDWVQPDCIGIMGGSYGGYMTVAALAFEPDVFEAGIDIFGVTNWNRTLTSLPPWWEAQRVAFYDEMGDPATDMERLMRISPLFHADKITKPLLVVQGANDPRVLKVESDEIVEAMQRNNVPVEYLVFDDEGHGFRKKSNRIAASEAYLSFLTKYLKDKEGANTASVDAQSGALSCFGGRALSLWAGFLLLLGSAFV